MLLTLARSKKKFGPNDLRELIEDVGQSDWSQVEAVFGGGGAKRVGSSGTKKTTDPFVTRIEKRRRKFDLPAADAATLLIEELGVGALKPAERKSFAILLKTLRARTSDARVESGFEDVLARHAARYSLKYDLA